MGGFYYIRTDNVLWLTHGAYRANYVVAVDGQFLNVWGTSASSPVLAAMLSAINDARLAVGKSTIGFINPTVHMILLTYGYLRESL